MSLDIDLKNKKIIITGASKGLGAVCAKALAQHDATLVLLARSKEKLEAVQASCKSSKKHLILAADLTDMKKLPVTIKKARDFLGGVDVVLHVLGGGLGLRDPLLHFSDLLKLFTLNIGVAAEINRLVFPEMKQKGSGNLVHVASIASTEATGSVGYNTVKSALAAYVRSFGREAAKEGVIVNGILPGGFYAPENSWARLESKKPEVVKKFIHTYLPRGHLGQAEEVVPMVLLLCSNLASMTGGCLIPLDAGEGRAYTTHTSN